MNGDIVTLAWRMLQLQIEPKTSRGRNELKAVMAQCLQTAVEEQ